MHCRLTLPAETAAGPLPAPVCAAELGALLVKATLRRPKGSSPLRVTTFLPGVGPYASMLVAMDCPPQLSFCAAFHHELDPATAREPSYVPEMAMGPR